MHFHFFEASLLISKPIRSLSVGAMRAVFVHNANAFRIIAFWQLAPWCRKTAEWSANFEASDAVKLSQVGQV